jgi:hypothetical protein
MTASPIDPPLAPDELVATGSEREVLEAFLDFHRGVVVRKLSGVSGADARRRLVPSQTTLIGIVRHLAGVESDWFERRLGGADVPRRTGTGNAPDESWSVGEDKTIEDVIAEYHESCDRSREVAARFALEDSVPHPRLGRVSLRWIYVHMIEETARHAGHADILREQVDGASGVDG